MNYIYTTLSAEAVECWSRLQQGKTSPTMSLVMLEDRILVTEQSVTQQPKWSSDLQHSTLILNRLDNQKG